MEQIWIKLVEYQRQFLPEPWIQFIPRFICNKRRFRNPHPFFTTILRLPYRIRPEMQWIWEKNEQEVFAANPWGTQKIKYLGWQRAAA